MEDRAGRGRGGAQWGGPIGWEGMGGRGAKGCRGPAREGRERGNQPGVLIFEDPRGQRTRAFPLYVILTHPLCLEYADNIFACRRSARAWPNTRSTVNAHIKSRWGQEVTDAKHRPLCRPSWRRLLEIATIYARVKRLPAFRLRIHSISILFTPSISLGSDTSENY